MSEPLSTDAIASILKTHGYWLSENGSGTQADLRSAGLRYANLSYADLSYADLRSADLRSADLSSADLRSADLSYADPRYAALSYADLRHADLRSADLRYADLRYAKASDKLIYMRAPACISGARHNIEESVQFGILIGCAQNVTSKKLPALFEKYSAPESMRPFYIAAVKMIEEYAAKCPLCEETQ